MDFARTILRQFKFFEPLEILIPPTSKRSRLDSRHPSFPAVWLRCADLLIPDELETMMWETGKTVDGAMEIIFETRVNGKPVLGNGRALIRKSATKSKL